MRAFSGCSAGIRNWGKLGLGLAVLALVVSLLLEVVAVFTLPKPPVDRAPFVKTTRHPRLGYVLVPNQDTFSYSERVTTNTDGLRDDRELDRRELRGARVILCLGGSETFGKGVAQEQTYSRVLEHRLNRGPDTPRHVVVNAGVPDYKLDQSLRFLEERGEKFFPDVVVLGFYWDDLFPALDSPDLSPAGSREWLPRRWASRRGVLERLSPLYTRSRVLCFTRNRLKTWIGRWRGHDSIRWRDGILTERPVPELDRAWRRAGQLLEGFSGLARQRGFRVLVLILPIEQQLAARQRSTAFQAEVMTRAKFAGLDTLDLLPRFEESYEGWASLFLPYDGRPNAHAHEIIADALFDRLVSDPVH